MSSWYRRAADRQPEEAPNLLTSVNVSLHTIEGTRVTDNGGCSTHRSEPLGAALLPAGP